MHAAVIGAGWAGCAAAVTLARLGHRVTVYETAAIAGGRARRVPRAGLAIDNGQHLLLGAYTHTRNLLAAVHGGSGEQGLARSRLAIEPLVEDSTTLRLRARHLPAPLGLLAGLLTARGLTFGERLGVVTWFQRLARADFRCAADATVADLVAAGPAAARKLWDPLCLAALNTPPERASGQVFANVLKAAFASDAAASDFLLPATDLSALFPDAALRFVERHGGRVALRTRARLTAAGDATVIVSTDHAVETFDAVIVAVAPHQVDDTIPVAIPEFRDALLAAQELAFEPIATVWLGYATRRPLPAQLTRLDDAPGQWIVERSDVLANASADQSRPELAQLVAVVISSSGPHEKLEAHAIANACDAQLRRLVPGWPALAWSQTIDEQRATYACTPGRSRPASAHPHRRVAFAGDWLDTEFPATLEAAVRTGVAAANLLDDALA